MSETRKTAALPDATTAKKGQQNAAPTLRPLAPKPLLPPPPRPLAIRSATPQSSGTTGSGSQRPSPVSCAVCYRLGCQLPTHTAFVNLSRSSSENSPEKQAAPTPQRDLVFTTSYAFRLAQQYVDTDVAAARVDPYYELPLGSDMNNTETHRLFHSWFAAESPITPRIPRPREIAGDFLCGPFLLPALQDPLLCLGILAASAASLPHLTQTQPQNVLSLTLLGQAIQQMRERIKSDPIHMSDTTIIAAVYLWVANIFLEDTAAMISHSKSIHAFVETRGGLQELGLDGAVERFIRWVDAIHCFILPVPCHYLDLLNPATASDNLPTRYGSYWDDDDMNRASKIDAGVVQACQSTCWLVEYLEQVEQDGISGRQYFDVTQRLCILLTEGSVLRARHHARGHIDECVSIAIAIVQYHCFCCCEKINTMTAANLERLITAIKATGGPMFWERDLDLLIWLLFVVVMTPVDLDEKSWCLPFLCRIIVTRFGRRGKIHSNWDHDLKNCLHRFAWSELRLDSVFKRTCRLIAEVVDEYETEEEEEDASDSEVDAVD